MLFRSTALHPIRVGLVLRENAFGAASFEQAFSGSFDASLPAHAGADLLKMTELDSCEAGHTTVENGLAAKSRE